MWLVIVFGALLVFGPTRRMVGRNWRFCIPALGGAVIGWELGRFVFGAHPVFSWVPWAWSVIAGLMAGKAGKQWLDEALGGQ